MPEIHSCDVLSAESHTSLSLSEQIKHWKGEKSTASYLLQMTTQDPDNHLFKVAQIVILWLN